MFDHGIVSAMDPLRKAIGPLEHLYDELIVVYREVQELAAYAVEVNVRQDDLSGGARSDFGCYATRHCGEPDDAAYGT